MSALHLITLGRCALLSGGAVVLRSRPKELALLAYLALSSERPVTRVELVRLFWNDRNERRSRHALSQALHSLKRTLPNLTIGSGGDELWISPGKLQVDVSLFRTAIVRNELEEAARHFAGHFMNGLRISATRDFEEWQEQTRAQLSHEALVVFRSLARSYYAAGDVHQAGHFAAQALRLQPMDEQMIRIGREAASVDLRSANRDTVAQFPIPDLRSELAPELACRHPTLPFVGRSHELAAAQEIFHAAAVRGLRVLSVTGEAGVGKTRFCEQVLRWAAIRGARVLHGRCSHGASQLPYGAIASALADGFDSGDLSVLSTRLRRSLCRIVPELCHPRGQQLAHGASPRARQEICESSARLLAISSGDRPTALFLDDFQWSDDLTIRLLSYLLQRLPNATLFVLLASRPKLATEGAVAAFLRHLPADRCDSISLDEFDEPTVRELVSKAYAGHAHGDLHELGTELFRLVGGHAFLLGELILAAQRDGRGPNGNPSRPQDLIGPRTPSSIERFLSERVCQLTGEETNVLKATAVLGDQATLNIISRLTGANEDRATRSLDSLKHTRLIRITRTRIAFAHDLVREAVYAPYGRGTSASPSQASCG